MSYAIVQMSRNEQDRASSAWGAIAEWLGHIFLTPPDTAFTERLRKPETGTLLRELGENFGCPQATEAMKIVIGSDENRAVSSKLVQSYTELFEGVSGPRTVLLYESAYHGDGHRLFQKPLSEMNATLEQLDMAVIHDCVEPADHLAIELAALGHAIRCEDTIETAALVARLAAWTPALSKSLETRDRIGFYAAAAKLLTAYLQALAEALAISASGKSAAIH
jgi:TorA-specific chaperone